MNGINIDNLDSLIKKSKAYLNSYSSDSRRLVNAINELRSCYSGASLDYLFKPLKETSNIESITDVVDSYVDTLQMVKSGYQKQDSIFKSQINNIDL